MAMQATKERKDLVGSKFIKGTDDGSKIEDVEIKETLKDYYTSLMNQENTNIIEDTIRY